MVDIRETFDGSAVMEICGNRTLVPADPILKPVDGRSILADLAANLARFDGSKIDRGPQSAIDELRQHKQWVAWRYLLRPGASTPTKPPVSPITGSGASHSNPAHWSSYEAAEAFAERRNSRAWASCCPRMTTSLA